MLMVPLSVSHYLNKYWSWLYQQAKQNSSVQSSQLLHSHEQLLSRLTLWQLPLHGQPLLHSVDQNNAGTAIDPSSLAQPTTTQPTHWSICVVGVYAVVSA